MVTQSRARSQQAKAVRRERILDCAQAVLLTTRYPDLTLQVIAQGAGLTKPALFSYFPSKEALFLELYERGLGQWMTALDKHLRLGGTHTPGSLATLVTALTLEQPALLRLIPLQPGLLEHNITAERALAHKRWLAARVATLGGLLESALPGLPAGLGLPLLTYTQALIAGLYPMSEPSAAVRTALEVSELGWLHVDLRRALEDGLGAVYRGLCEQD